MLIKADIKGFAPPADAVVFNEDVFVDSIKRNSRSSDYSTKVVDAIYEGGVVGMMVDLDVGKISRIAGRKELGKIFYKLINSDCPFYEVLIGKRLSEYKEIPAYSKLFELNANECIHVPDIASVIASVETDRMLVTNDYHHWKQQSNLIRTYRERHAPERAKQIVGRGKVKDFMMMDSKDFCKLVLHL